MIALATVAGVAVLGGAIALGVHAYEQPGTQQAAKAPAGTTASRAPVPSDGEPGVSNGTATVKPMIAGWQTQAWADHGFTYDVPPASKGWKVFPPDERTAYLDAGGNPIVVMSGTANYREGGCPSPGNPSAVGQAGKGQLATIGSQGGAGDLGTNARNAAGNWGFAAYGGPDHKPKIQVGPATPWNHNGIEGYAATARITVTYRPSACVPPSAIVHSIAQRLKDGTVHEWVIYADQGVPGALTDAEIEKIMSTVRPSRD